MKIYKVGEKVLIRDLTAYKSGSKFDFNKYSSYLPLTIRSEMIKNSNTIATVVSSYRNSGGDIRYKLDTKISTDEYVFSHDMLKRVEYSAGDRVLVKFADTLNSYGCEIFSVAIVPPMSSLNGKTTTIVSQRGSEVGRYTIDLNRFYSFASTFLEHEDYWHMYNVSAEIKEEINMHNNMKVYGFRNYSNVTKNTLDNGVYGYHSADGATIFQSKTTIRDKPIPTSLYMGFELEFYDSSDKDDLMQSFTDWADENKQISDVDGAYLHAEYDGSLGDDGVEFISEPCTLARHTEVGLHKVLNSLATENNCRCSGAGLHVHVNKNFFNKDDDSGYYNNDLGKVINKRIHTIIMSHMELHKEEWEKISRRSFGDYCREINNYVYSNSREDRIDEAYHDRYSAFNVTKRGTYEFRLFKSTTLGANLISTLQFVSNLCHMLKEHLRSGKNDLDFIQNTTIKDIVDFKNYRQLNAYYDKYVLESTYVDEDLD